MISILLRKVATCQVQLQSGFLDAIHKAREIAYRIGLRISYWMEPCTINYCKYTYMFYMVISYWMDCKSIVPIHLDCCSFGDQGKEQLARTTITPGPGLHVAEGGVRDPQMPPVEAQLVGFKDRMCCFCCCFLVLLPVRPIFFGALDIINNYSC